MFEFVVQLATARSPTSPPASLADLTLSAAEYGLFEAVYSDHLLAEIQRVLVDHKGLAPANAQRFMHEICETFPNGRITATNMGARPSGGPGQARMNTEPGSSPGGTVPTGSSLLPVGADRPGEAPG